MLDKITEFLSNPLYSLLLATFIGIVSNLLTGKYFDRTKKLWWGVSSDWLNSLYFEETNNLKMTYKGIDNKYKEIKDSLSVLRFVIWSNGKDTLRQEDISSKEPLIITLEQNTEILEIRHIASSNPTLQTIPVGKNSILINFEYLKMDQGITFDVIISGYAEKAYLNGVLKDGQILTKELRPSSFVMTQPFLPRKWNPYKRITVAKWVFTSFFILSLWISISIVQAVIGKPFSFDNLVITLQMIFVALSYVFFSYPFWTTPVVPKELVKFYDRIV